MAGTAGLESGNNPERPFQALRALSVQFVSFMIEKGLEGQKLDKIVNGFTRHQTKIVGGVLGSAGLAGGAVYGALSLTRSRGKIHKLRSIIGFSKLLINQDEFRAQDLRLMQRFLKAQNVKEKQIETLLKTSPELAQQLALKHLSATERADVARYIFPHGLCERRRNLRCWSSPIQPGVQSALAEKRIGI